MASITHSKLLYRAAKKLGIKATDISDKKNQSKILFEHNDKMYIASENHVYPNIKLWVRKMMNDKILAQKVLKKKGYNTIPSKDFKVKQYSSEAALLKDIKKLKPKYPVITKTNSGTYGLGITFISNEKELLASAKHLYKKKKRFMVQPITWHDEYRITLIEKTPIMVHKKRLPRVVGDGVQTISQLLKTHPEALKDENFIKWNLKQQSFTPKTILEQGEIFETHIIKKRTPEYFKTANFPRPVVSWGKVLLADMSATTVAIDFVAPKGLDHPEDFVIFEINANPHWVYVIDELGDSETPKKICEHILTSYFGKTK